MKTRLFTLTLTAVALFGTTALTQAQDENRPRREGGRGAPVTPEARLKQLNETATLSQEQQEKIKAIMEKHAPERKKLMEDQSGSREDRMAKMREIGKAEFDEINAVLTDEQKEKVKEARAKRASERGNRGEGRPNRGGDKPAGDKPAAE